VLGGEISRSFLLRLLTANFGAELEPRRTGSEQLAVILATRVGNNKSLQSLFELKYAVTGFDR
jgi:hypothetical protein